MPKKSSQPTQSRNTSVHSSARILGIDPGKRNAWWCLFEPSPLTKTLQFQCSEQIDMKPDIAIMPRCDHHVKLVVKLLRNLKPTHIFAERFFNRPGLSKGNVSEIINPFLGILYAEAKRRKICTEYFTSSQHKKWRRELWQSDEGFAAAWPELNVHQQDACSIANYGWTVKQKENEE